MPTAPEDLRVCVATDEFYPMGGTERQVVELAIELQRRAIPVTVLSRLPLPAGNPYVRELREAAIPLVSPGWSGRKGGRLRRLPYLLARVRGGSAEGPGLEEQLWRWQAGRVRAMRVPGFVLHEIPFFGMFTPAGCRTLRSLGVPLVHTIFGRMEGVIPVLDVAGAIVTTDADPLVEPPGTPMRWIPSMGPRLLADHVPNFGRPRTRILSFGGRLVPEKGVDILLKAAAQIPDIKVIVAGYGPERQNLERLATQLGVNAEFTGPLAQAALHALLSHTDVAVFPGVQGEGVPSFIVEALASGVPVVATDVGALARALDHGPYLVSPGDPIALSAAVYRLLQGSDIEAERRRARERFDEHFSPAKVVDAYLTCYADALRLSSPTPIRDC